MARSEHRRTAQVGVLRQHERRREQRAKYGANVRVGSTQMSDCLLRLLRVESPSNPFEFTPTLIVAGLEQGPYVSISNKRGLQIELLYRLKPASGWVALRHLVEDLTACRQGLIEIVRQACRWQITENYLV